MKWHFGRANTRDDMYMKVARKVGKIQLKDSQTIDAERKRNRKLAKIANRSRKNNRCR